MKAIRRIRRHRASNIGAVASKLRRPAAAAALAVAAAVFLPSAAQAQHPPDQLPPRAVAKPKLEFDPIPYDRARKRQMAAYSKRHYGERSWRLDDPKAIVLHYTATSTYAPVFNAFAANAPSLGEKPGVCAQFVVGKDGTIHQLTRLYVRCRHTIGLNQTAIGIEMVQQDVGSRHGAERAILGRRAQARAAVHLTAWLKQRYRIEIKNVIGHAMANDSPLFRDLEGWRNDHVDWRAGDVRDFRKRVTTLIRDGRS